jgi:hypothetical protein
MNGRVDIGVDVGGGGGAAGGQAGLLSIAAGARIFADTQATFLVVNRGSQLIADGTTGNPIVFTSRQNVEGTATDASDNQWGGILMLGRAPISNCLSAVPGGSQDCQQQAEGTNAPALYGGALSNDSSGSLRNVQIRFTGFSLAPNAELQGLTLGGVGAGTTIQNIHVHNSGDDGVEIFGGTANIKNFVVTGADDDTLDTDFGYKGFIQFMIGIQRPQSVKTGGDTMIEADSNSPGGDFDFTPRQFTRLANFTFVQTRTGSRAIHLRGGTDYALINGVVVAPGTCLDVDDAQTVQTSGPDEFGPPIIKQVAFDCPTLADPDSDTFEATALGATHPAPFGQNSYTHPYTNTLSAFFINGANENAIASFNASQAGSFFVNTSYIGAVRDANDTWYRGFTCDSGYVNFGAGRNCNTI